MTKPLRRPVGFFPLVYLADTKASDRANWSKSIAADPPTHCRDHSSLIALTCLTIEVTTTGT